MEEQSAVILTTKKTKTKTNTNTKERPPMLSTSYTASDSAEAGDAHTNTNTHTYEVGVDEAGRGPLFGRVYTAAVILPPPESSFDFSLLKDSKKFHSEKKIREASDYIKEHAVGQAMSYE